MTVIWGPTYEKKLVSIYRGSEGSLLKHYFSGDFTHNTRLSENVYILSFYGNVQIWSILCNSINVHIKYKWCRSYPWCCIQWKTKNSINGTNLISRLCDRVLRNRTTMKLSHGLICPFVNYCVIQVFVIYFRYSEWNSSYTIRIFVLSLVLCIFFFISPYRLQVWCGIIA